MKNILSLILVLLTAACAHNHTHDARQFVPSEHSRLTRSETSILRLADELALELTGQSTLFAENVPVVVMAPVMANNFSQTANFSASLQQSLMSALKRRNYQVTDVNVTDNLKVTPEGEFMLARDWRVLPQNLAVEHVIVTTVDLSQSGVVLNSRVVDLNDNSVLSAAVATMPVTEFSSYLALSDKVAVRDGIIYRYPRQGQENVRQLGVK